jgi:DNA-directed RNA polymerase specialized sigma24 family protein
MQYRVVAADAFSTQRQFLWDLCYRVTGAVGDADMLLRDCFAECVEHPLVEPDIDWRPHLVRSAAMLAMDLLRHRKRRHYLGAWLPSPIETGSATSQAPRSLAANGARYDMVESGSMGFLKALEALEPRERVVLVMCDAFGFHVQETASTLDFTSASVRGLLQHARRKMQPYDAAHDAPTREVQAQVAALLRDCLTHLQGFDAPRLEKILALDAQALFDSGGEFVAPSGSVFGSSTVAKVLTKFARGMGPISFSFRMLNGLPAALGQSQGRARWAKHFVLSIDAREGLVSEVHVILATAKLTAVRFDPL